MDINNKYSSYFILSQEYFNAASLLLKETVDQNNKFYDPSMFLYRHSIELAIKGILEFYNFNFTYTHDLSRIWKEFLSSNLYKKIFTEEEIISITALLDCFTNLNKDVDKYRFPYNKQGDYLGVDEVAFDDVAPDLSNGIPYIIENSENRKVLLGKEHDVYSIFSIQKAAEILQVKIKSL